MSDLFTLEPLHQFQRNVGGSVMMLADVVELLQPFVEPERPLSQPADCDFRRHKQRQILSGATADLCVEH